jgi:hypothetical protein
MQRRESRVEQRQQLTIFQNGKIIGRFVGRISLYVVRGLVPRLALAASMNELHVFAAALEIVSPAQRSCFLDVACGNDQDLRRRIDGPLRSHEEAGNLVQVTGPVLDAIADKTPPE